MYCLQCHASNKPPARFCNQCGASLFDFTPQVTKPKPTAISPIFQIPASQPDPTSQTNKLFYGFVAILLSCGLCGIGGLIFSPNKTPPDTNQFNAPTESTLPLPTPTASREQNQSKSNRATTSPSSLSRPTVSREKMKSQSTLTGPVVKSTKQSRGTSGYGGRSGSHRSGYTWGPRGGCYYINGNGNKTYVPHSYCR